MKRTILDALSLKFRSDAELCARRISCLGLLKSWQICRVVFQLTVPPDRVVISNSLFFLTHLSYARKLSKSLKNNITSQLFNSARAFKIGLYQITEGHKSHLTNIRQ